VVSSFGSLLQASATAGTLVLTRRFWWRCITNLCVRISIGFLNKSLKPIWANEEVQQRVSVQLHPFGNARLLESKDVSEGYHYWHPDARYPVVICQHDEEECLGNRIQACAIADLDSKQHVAFVVCMASTFASPERSSYECGERLSINMTAIKACVESDRGHNLFVEHGKRSLAPALNRSYVPFVLVDGQHSKRAESGDLLGSTCEVMTEPRPAACSRASLGTSGVCSILLALIILSFGASEDFAPL